MLRGRRSKSKRRNKPRKERAKLKQQEEEETAAEAKKSENSQPAGSTAKERFKNWRNKVMQSQQSQRSLQSQSSVGSDNGSQPAGDVGAANEHVAPGRRNHLHRKKRECSRIQSQLDLFHDDGKEKKKKKQKVSEVQTEEREEMKKDRTSSASSQSPPLPSSPLRRKRSTRHSRLNSACCSKLLPWKSRSRKVRAMDKASRDLAALNKDVMRHRRILESASEPATEEATPTASQPADTSAVDATEQPAKDAKEALQKTACSHRTTWGDA